MSNYETSPHARPHYGMHTYLSCSGRPRQRPHAYTAILPAARNITTIMRHAYRPYGSCMVTERLQAFDVGEFLDVFVLRFHANGTLFFFFFTEHQLHLIHKSQLLSLLMHLFVIHLTIILDHDALAASGVERL